MLQISETAAVHLEAEYADSADVVRIDVPVSESAGHNLPCTRFLYSVLNDVNFQFL